MNERHFTTKLVSNLNKLPTAWFYKIPDLVMCPKCGSAGLGSRRPFDIVGVKDGKAFAIEVKMTSIKDLAPHQEAALVMFQRKGKGEALVAIADRLIYQFNIERREWVEASVSIYSYLKNSMYNHIDEIFR